MHLIDVPLEQFTELCHRLNPTPLFEALICARTSRSARGETCRDGRPLPQSSVARELNATIASSREELRAAGELVMRRYAWRGYMVDARMLNHPAPGEARNSPITLIASDAAGDTVGTLTLGLDGPEGLLVDDVYGIELDAIRAAGRRICELTRLAVDKGVDSRTVLAALFSLAFLVTRVLHRATDVFIEVNPRHVAFYERALGFVVAAGERVCERVKAPSVLLRLELEKLEARLQEHGFGSIDDCFAGS
jgi:N-acyl amino acid synthase FeeM